ncbi:hypothetical protein ACJJTC_001826 [Scirpophaga incertulas]
MASRLRLKAKETVLCIGDGGNDVSMITSADIGVGIEGKEGSQASLAADFSLKCFSDVAGLMFYHSRRSYKNSSKMAHIIFHRGILISFIQGIFCALIHFFPISILHGNMPTLFILFTILPLFWIIYDEDISMDMAIKYPELYKELRENDLLSYKEFLSTLTISSLVLKKTLESISFERRHGLEEDDGHNEVEALVSKIGEMSTGGGTEPAQ